MANRPETHDTGRNSPITIVIDDDESEVRTFPNGVVGKVLSVWVANMDRSTTVVRGAFQSSGAPDWSKFFNSAEAYEVGLQSGAV